MKKKPFLNTQNPLLKYKNFSTLYKKLDLAEEAHCLLRGEANLEVPGVKEDIENYPEAKITTITILNPQGEDLMGKKMGHYINIAIPRLAEEKDLIGPISKLVAKKLKQLMPQKHNCIMLIGLGNTLATPDSLGPRVVDKTIATRHIKKHAPKELAKGLKSLCIMAPGVLGITGIETAEIIKGTVDHVKPDCLIAVDSLAAGNICRVGTTIQIADTGINPGSGVGNKRAPINEEYMGVPTIAIGVPTVVDTNIIIYETISNLLEIWQKELKNTPRLESKTINEISENLLSAFEGNLIVTPREIDSLISDISLLIAASLAQAVHSGVDENNYPHYLR